MKFCSSLCLYFMWNIISKAISLNFFKQWLFKHFCERFSFQFWLMMRIMWTYENFCPKCTRRDEVNESTISMLLFIDTRLTTSNVFHFRNQLKEFKLLFGISVFQSTFKPCLKQKLKLAEIFYWFVSKKIDTNSKIKPMSIKLFDFIFLKSVRKLEIS